MTKKVYITKYCLTQGIVYDEVFIIDPIKKIARTKQSTLLKKNDFFFDVDKAIQNAELRKLNKIKKIEKTLKETKLITFTGIKK
jgi:hypothetical protein